VEYHDPSGVFPLVSRDISARLPLRNLNWQSPLRPLRQIRQLHVEFVPDSYTRNSLRPTVHQTDSNGPNGIDNARRDQGAKGRRHQIPGLKTSPYLRIYVLRCDDKDTYKEAARKRIREWVQEAAPSDGKRENHDASEWLILHVVVPDTVAASESRWREATSSKDSDELKERPKSSAKWPGKSSRTVFDRLRADFNESGKSAQDRVAQIRLLKSDVPPDLLPTPAVAPTFEETPQERDRAWKDLVDKFKILILGPFDARVRQYEADIAAQESRRSLPGWNFCTFFIHKEGLAKALESIGLVEDALVIYDELSLGLESVLRDIASGKAEGTATTFATYTDDIEARISGKAGTVANGSTDEHRLDQDYATLGIFNKDYREKIVTSSISVFDFFGYLFYRQKALILRLANTRASRAELGGSIKEGGEDVVLISEVCWRTSSFLHNSARTLRQDLASRYARLPLPLQIRDITLTPCRPAAPPRVDIEDLVSSWTYAVAEEVLSETAASVLDPAQRPDNSEYSPSGTSKPKRPDFSFGMGANPYPQRSSSLAIKKAAPELQRPPLRAVTEGVLSPPSSSGTDVTTTETVTISGIPGLPELATYRAELLMMQRKMVESLARSRGWLTGLYLIRHSKGGVLDNVDIDDGDAEGVSDVNALGKPSVLSPLLAATLESESAFQAAYERLSEQAMRLFAQATHNKSVEAIIADFAMLKCQQGDYATAAEYFMNVLPTYTTENWSVAEAELLSSYAKCLKELERREEYVKTVMEILLKVRERLTARLLPRMHFREDTSMLEDEMVSDASGLLSDLIAYSSSLTDEKVIPMDWYFTDIHVNQEVMHREDMDGFGLRLTFRHVLDDEIEADEVATRLVSIDDPNQEIWLESDGADRIIRGLVAIDLKTTIIAFGGFLIDKIVVKAKKLRFVHEFKPPRPEVVTRLGIIEYEASSTDSASAQPFVLVYPDLNTFYAEVSVSKVMQINKPRHLEVALSSGRNDIESIDLRLKPFSGGLRLYIADATSDGILRRAGDDVGTGWMGLGKLETSNSAVVRIPYTVDQAAAEIAVRLEARYHTSHGSFTFLGFARHSHELPIDVDVNDFFQPDALFSKFTIGVTGRVPLYLTSATLDESEVYSVEAPPLYDMPMPIFAEQPSNLLYKVGRKPTSGTKFSRKNAALALKLEYQPADELLKAIIRSQFEDDLRHSPYNALSRLLLPVLSERCKQLFSKAELNPALLVGEHQVPTYEVVGWQDMVSTLPRAVQGELSNWLKAWHEQHTHVSCDTDAVAAQAVRRLSMPVDVPTIDFVHDVSLSVLPRESDRKAGADILTLGQPVKAHFSVSTTDAWSAKRLLQGQQDTRGTTTMFIYEIQAEGETWLVGGQRRGHFAVENENERPFEGVLTLIPIKVGKLPLPTVEVHPEPEETGADGKGSREPSVLCETYCESAGQTIEVVRDRQTMEVHVFDDLESGTAVAGTVVESSSRPSTATKPVAEAEAG